MTDFILLISIVLLLVISQIAISRAYNKYSVEAANLSYTGEDIVKNMLMASAVHDVEIRMINGTLNDHYNSNNKTISLSKHSCNKNTIASIAVAAHETGHAIQDHENYSMLKLRKFLGPICSFCSRFVWIAIFLGILFQYFNLITIGLVLMGVTILFQVVTLPVEFDASKRAINYLNTLGYDEYTIKGVKKMLTAAAFTYVASTLGALLQMLRLVLRFTRDD